MDKSQINANLCKKISANEQNTPLERALADKCLDIYKKLAERAEECDKYRKILYSQFVKVNKIFGFQFNETHQNEINCSKDAQIKKLLAKTRKEGEG